MINPVPLASFPHEKLPRIAELACPLDGSQWIGRYFGWIVAMEKSVSEARWLLIPVFGLSGIVMCVGIIFG